MPRILLLIVLIWVLYVVVKRFMANTSSNRPFSKKDAKAEKVVACSQCGLHIPESESHLIDNLIVCNNPGCCSQKE